MGIFGVVEETTSCVYCSDKFKSAKVLNFYFTVP